LLRGEVSGTESNTPFIVMGTIRRLAKILLLIFGLLPYIYFILFFTIVGPGERTTSLFFTVLFVLTAISIPGAFIFYVINVYRNKSVMKEKKHLCAALLFFGHIIVYPFYWYLYIWREPKEVYN
jgi:hypothetical protein